jgi:hypothetical protein
VTSPRNKLYTRLLQFLFEKDFRWSLKLDSNRSEDGKELRNRFCYEYGISKEAERELYGPCSVLEMMVAMAIIAEDHVMSDPEIGDRTSYWFWCMIKSLGLSEMNDYSFDRGYVDFVVERFLDRKYEPNGKGSIFTVENPRQDMREVELWYQMMWFLDCVIKKEEVM